MGEDGWAPFIVICCIAGLVFLIAGVGTILHLIDNKKRWGKCFPNQGPPEEW